MTGIGINYTSGHWKTCLTENGKMQDFSTFTDIQSTFSYVNQFCREHPNALVALSSSQEAPFLPLHSIIHEQRASGNEYRDVQEFLHLIAWHFGCLVEQAEELSGVWLRVGRRSFMSLECRRRGGS